MAAKGARALAAALVAAVLLGAPATAYAGQGPVDGGGDAQSLPTAQEVLAAAADAMAAAELADAISTEEARARARLLTLQDEVSRAARAVSAAEEQVRRADADVAAAAERVAQAQADIARAERARAEQAARAYQQGGSLGLLPSLIDPGIVESLPDLTVLLEDQALRREVAVVQGRSARDRAVDAQRQLGEAQAARALTAARLVLARTAAEAAVEQAAHEVVAVTARLTEAQTRLDELAGAATGLGLARSRGLTADVRARAEAAGRGHLVGAEAMTFGSDPEVLAAQLDPKPFAKAALADHGWGGHEWGCLHALWQGESGWSWSATNTTSGAYGIPQSLPAWKMATAGPDWLLDPRTQIRWGLDYIDRAYGSPCVAWQRWQERSPHWY